jgi:broad specificity phosphatase PhoE
MQVVQVAAAIKELEAQGVVVSKIMCSPLIRCVQTADIVAGALGIDCVTVENGLMEEAKSFRGHPPTEPAPRWDPLVLPLETLHNFSSRLKDPDHESLEVRHTLDFSCTKNGASSSSFCLPA